METPPPAILDVASTARAPPSPGWVGKLQRWSLAMLLVGSPIAAVFYPQIGLILMAGYLLMGAWFRSPLIVCSSLGILCMVPMPPDAFGRPTDIAVNADVFIAAGLLIDVAVRHPKGDWKYEIVFAVLLVIVLPAGVICVQDALGEYRRQADWNIGSVLIGAMFFSALYLRIYVEAASSRDVRDEQPFR